MGEEIKKIILELLEQKNKVVEFEKKIEEMNQEEKVLQAERDRFTDKESGFYKDAKAKLDNFRALRNACIRTKEIEKHKLEDQIKHKKAEIVTKLQEKLKMIDENRNTTVEELKKEQKELERQISLNDVRGEAFEALSPEDRKEVIMAYRNVLNNKHRLNDILLKIAIVEALEGKEPKDKYLEISDILAEIEEKFTYDNIDQYKEEFDKVEEITVEDLVVDEEKLDIEEISAISKEEEKIEESETKSEKQEETKNTVKEAKDSFEEFLLTPVEESMRKIKEEQQQLEEDEDEQTREARRQEMRKKEPKTEFEEFLLTPVEETMRKIKEEQSKAQQVESQQPKKVENEEKSVLKPQEVKAQVEPQVKNQEKPQTKPEGKPQTQPKQQQTQQSETKRPVRTPMMNKAENKPKNNHSIVATYLAKDRDYLMKNIDVKNEKGKPTERKVNEVLDIANGDKNYSKKIRKREEIKNFDKLDITFLKALKLTDEKYNLNKAQIYYNLITNPEKYGSPREVKKYLKDNNLKIVYDLRGIYDEPENENMAMSDADRTRMLKLANYAKKMGIAKVKKGLRVSILEAIDGMKSNKTKRLGSGEKQEKRKIKNEPKKQTEKKRFKGKVSDYMKEMKVELKRDIKNVARRLNDFADRMKVDEATEKRLNEVSENATAEKNEESIEEQEAEEVK